MDKNQKPTSEDVAQATAEVDSILKDPRMVNLWVDRAARDEIAQRRARAAARGDDDSQDALITEDQAAQHIASVGFVDLLNKVRAQQIEQRARSYPRMRAAAAARSAADTAANTCPVCGEYSNWGHRARQFSDIGSTSGNLDSCLPCFLEAQEYWRELRRTPKRSAAVRQAVDAILRNVA